MDGSDFTLFNLEGARWWTRGFSSAGRAPALQAGGHRFESGNLHHTGGAPRKIADFVGKRKSERAGAVFAEGGNGAGELVMTRANSSAG